MKQHPGGQCWQVLNCPGLFWGMAKQNLYCWICYGKAILNIVLSMRCFQLEFDLYLPLFIRSKNSFPCPLQTAEWGKAQRWTGIKPWEGTQLFNNNKNGLNLYRVSSEYGEERGYKEAAEFGNRTLSLFSSESKFAPSFQGWLGMQYIDNTQR